MSCSCPMNVRPLSMGSTLMAPKKSMCPRQGKIRYDVRTGKPFPNQFDEEGRPKTGGVIRKWNPKEPCPWLLAAKSKRWYGSRSLPESEVTAVCNPDVAYAQGGYNQSNLYGAKCEAIVPPFEVTATLQDPFPWCSPVIAPNVTDLDQS